MDNLGKRVKTLRDNMELTQDELGDIIGLHGSNIGRIEKGKVFPSSDKLLKMAIYFGVSCDWLLTGEDVRTYNCENADESTLLHLYRQLSKMDKDDIQEMIQFKLYKAEKGKVNAKSSDLTTIKNGNAV